MPTVSAGSSAVIDVLVGQKVAVSTPGEAYVDIVAGALGAGYTSKRLAGNVLSQTFGPYGVVTRLNIRAIAGDVAYGPAVESVIGGATEFTQLADAPPVISPNAVICGNDDGTALANSYLTYEESNGERILHMHAHPDNGGEMGMVCDDGQTQAISYVDASTAQTWVAYGGSAQIGFNARNNVVELMKMQGIFVMTGFDVDASNVSARMTVNGVEYSIAKAIQVNVGGQEFFWPLFGPAA